MKRITALIIVLLHFLVLIQDCDGDKSFTDLTFKIKALQPRNKDCKLDVLEYFTDGVAVRCDDDNGDVVRHLATCDVDSTNTDVEIFKCIDGEWNPVYSAYGKGTGTGLAHHRQKRWGWGWISPVFTILKIAYCTTKDDFWKCEDREVIVENLEPPTYTNCPPSDLQSTYTAEQGSKTVNVTWSKPVAHDDKQVESNDLTCCGEYHNGDSFQALPGTGLQHTMTYTAKDNHGLEASCSFSFTAIYLTCDEPSIPENGKKDSCTQGYVYGSTCSYSCNTGYEMTGNANVECQDSETWTPGPTCSKIECPAPSDLNNGNTVCDSSTTYTYDDDCTFVCNDGFNLNGPFKMTCQADKTWSVDMDLISCTDSEPPVISCQSPQVFYADRGTFSTSVSWKEPSANDTVDADPSITKIEGPELGDELQAGLHYVRYRATDSENNSSPPLSECTITLEVKVIKCSTGPTDALNNSRFMTFNCSDTSFYNGVTCQLGCDLNLPLNGTDLMTCDWDGITDQGIWNWGSGSQPYCKVVECPTLDPPDFGALAYDTINARPIYVMLCQEGYDSSSVGSSFTGRMSCQDSGTWYPLDEFPDCIVSNLPIQFLNAELYYEGDCSDNATKEIIKEQLLQYFATLEADVDNSICPDDNTCKVENINLICGSTGRKRRSLNHELVKRNVAYARFTFEFTIQFQQQNLTTPDAYNHFTDILKNIVNTMQTMIDDGDFNINGFTLSSDAFKYEDWPQFSCLSGNKLDGVTCKPCPRGTYLNSTTGDCEYCNIGEYMDHDGALLCDSCADGYSTLSTGSKHVSKCIRKCSAGFQSSTTMEPCSACPIGTYQIGEGQTTCTMCPLGEITPSTNSTSVDQCGSFDLFVSGLDGMKEMANFNTSGNDVLTLAFWLKLQVEHIPDLTVQLTDTSGLSVALSFTDVLGITVGSSIYEINTVPLSHQKWTYIACTIDATSQQIKLYTDNTQVLDETNVQLDSSVPLGESSLSITTPTSHGVYLSGISAYGRVLTGAEVSDLTQSCSASIGGELMTMEDVKNRMTGEVVAVTPSVCDAINECESSPCGAHTCINEVDDFTCVCHGGMTGDLCDVPPDFCTGNECYHGNCISGNGTYTCDCTNGYSGVFCDREPVDGGWSEWGEWPACGAECNGGTRQRNRSCNNPTPGYMGNDCQGSGVETEECNTVVCPKCPTLEREFKTIVTCSDTDPDVTVCNMTCTDGTTLPNGQAAFEKYRCGKVTAYEWTPRDKLPVCVEYSKPPQLGFTNMATVTPTVATSAEEDYITHVQDGLSDVECVKSGQCSIDINLSSSSSRRKRSTGSTVTLQFTIVMTDQGELNLGEYLTSGTTTSSMSELLDAVNVMSNVTAHIQANMVSIFSGEVDGVQYTVDTGSLVVTARVYCDDGYAGTDGMCVQCPAGTRSANSLCISCDVGTYQSLPGQSSCITCPYGYTTKSYGSDDVAECSVVFNVTTHAPTSTLPTTVPVSSGSTSPSPTVTEGLSTTIILGICFSVTAFILSLIAIGCVLWKKLARKAARTMETNGSRASLNMIRPATNCQKINVVPDIRTTPSRPKFHKAPTTLTISDVELAQNKDDPPPYESLGFRETPFAHSSMSNKTT